MKHDHHKKAADSYEKAATNHKKAHEAQNAGNHEKAAHYAQTAQGHSKEASSYAGKATKEHSKEYGDK
jgi:hypothetical protein